MRVVRAARASANEDQGHWTKSEQAPIQGFMERGMMATA